MSSLCKLLLNTENTDKYIPEKYIPTKIISFLISDYILIGWNKGYVKKYLLNFKNFRNFKVVILHALNTDIKQNLVQIKTSHLEFASDYLCMCVSFKVKADKI